MAKVVKRKNSPFWYLKFMVKGKAFFRSSGTSDKRQAEKLLKQTVQDLRVKHTRQELTEEIFEQLTEQTRTKLEISEAWNAWLSSTKKRNPSPITVRGYEIHWKQFAEWLSKNQKTIKYLHEVIPALAERYTAYLWSQKVSPNTFNKNRNFLKSIFDVLSVQAGITSNPWNAIPTMQLETESRRALTPVELATICAKATGFLRYTIAIGLYTGLRLGDVCTLRWSEIDFEAGMIHRKARKKSRNGNELYIPIHPVLDAILRELPGKGESPYVFPDQAESYQKEVPYITNKFQAFFEQCGIKTTEKATGQRKKAIVRVGFHSLRHSFVSLCAANNVPQVAIMELVGHGSPAMTRLYSHAGSEEKARAIAALPSMLFDVQPEKKSKKETKKKS